MGRSIYRIIPIDSHTWCIQEKRLNQQCLLYLLEGENSALLIDTGYGFGKLGAVIAELTRLPVEVVNTHAHIDHIGGNHYFSEIYVNEADRGMFALHTDPVEVRQMVDEHIPLLLRPVLGGFRQDIINQTIAGNYHWFTLPQSFDLGGRTVEVLHTPGHTPGSICLLDRGRGYLFSGDTVCDWGVLLHLKGSLSLEIFRVSLESLWRCKDEFTTIYPGHHGLPVPIQRIEEYMYCADGALNGSISPTMVNKHREYHWKNIRITL